MGGGSLLLSDRIYLVCKFDFVRILSRIGFCAEIDYSSSFVPICSSVSIARTQNEKGDYGAIKGLKKNQNANRLT